MRKVSQLTAWIATVSINLGLRRDKGEIQVTKIFTLVNFEAKCRAAIETNPNAPYCYSCSGEGEVRKRH
jgi:hypothetical protein